MLPFTGVLKADEATPSATINQNSNVLKTGIKLTPDSSKNDVYTLKYGGSDHQFASTNQTINLKATNSVVNADDFSFLQGNFSLLRMHDKIPGYFDFDFKNSLYKGNITYQLVSNDGKDSNLKFDGSYTGANAGENKNYAFVGNITSGLNTLVEGLSYYGFNVFLSNGAKWKGDLSHYGNPNRNLLKTISLSGAGTEWDGNFTDQAAHYQILVTDGAKWNGDYKSLWNAYYGYGDRSPSPSIKISGSDSQWNAKDVYFGFSSNTSIDISNGADFSFQNYVDRNRNKSTFNLNNATINKNQSKDESNKLIFVANTFNLTATNNSNIKAHFYLLSSNISLKDSKIEGSIDTSTPNEQSNLINNIVLDNSKISQVKLNGTFNNVTLKNGSKIDDLQFKSGVKNSRITNSLLVDNATINKFSISGGDYFKKFDMTIENNSTAKMVNLNVSGIQDFNLLVKDSNFEVNKDTSLGLFFIANNHNKVTFLNSKIKNDGGMLFHGKNSAIDFENTTSESNISIKIGSMGFATINLKDSDLSNLSLMREKTDQNSNINATFDNSSIGDIKGFKSSTLLTFLNTAGKSIGNIGVNNSNSYYYGIIDGTFDFRKTTDSKQLSMGNIYGNNANLNMNFVFGGDDGSGNTKDKSSKLVEIYGGSKSSVVNFDNIGTLDFSATNKNIIDLIKDKTNISLLGSPAVSSTDKQATYTVSLTRTNVVLDSFANNQAKIQGTGFQFGELNISQGNLISGLNATFGNGSLSKDDAGNTIVVANNTDDAQDTSSFYRLTQKDSIFSSDASFVTAKSSDGDIGFKDDHFKKNITFAFTKGTFSVKDNQSGYTGHIYGGTDDSSYNFYNAGVLKYDQFKESVGSLNLVNTFINGIIGQTTKVDSVDKFVDVNMNLDYSGNDVSTYGLVIVGQGKHNINLDFTDNTNAVKFAGSILGGSASGANQISVFNLKGISTSSDKNTIQSAFHNAGFLAFNNKSPQISSGNTSNVTGFDGVSSDDKKDITKGTKIVLAGSSFTGSLKDNDYAFNFAFDTAPDKSITYSGLSNALQASAFKGDMIDLSSNSYDQSFSFSHSGSIKSQSGTNPVEIKLGTGKTDLSFKDTDGTVALKNTTGIKENSSLIATATSIIGDFKGNVNAVFGDTTTTGADGKANTSHSKFYGVLENGASDTLNVTLNPNSLYSKSDSIITYNYDGSASNVTLKFAGTQSKQNILNINNPGGYWKFKV
ncbi:hypothetical protein [Helicobacter sp. 13S00477-4]|uniref:hypothetical protein n=1 Tax=Helicobacter sp. 13S00477-4 TaxID=1905759 RepID=UPI000BA79D59|nr:hypothetical protein [Helicobacter sp. 13S00477-4]PAF52817.1 hypothetical protein BKH44_01135 [Helicobacter sp. 13S00477-4]